MADETDWLKFCGNSGDGCNANCVAEAACAGRDKRIAELESALSIARDLNVKYVDALRKISNCRVAVEIMDPDDVSLTEYSRALQRARLIARKALPITETK